MHFLVAFAPKIHVQLEFFLVSKIDLASASRAVWLAFHPRLVAKVVLVRPLGDVSFIDFGDLVATVATVGIEQMEYTWLCTQPEMTVIGRAREQDPFYMYLLNGSQMIEQASNLALN